MIIGNTEITKANMPSYQIGQEYPTRRYQFMQDTLNGALMSQQQMGMGQTPVQTQPNQPSQQNSTWNGVQK